MAFSVNF